MLWTKPGHQLDNDAKEIVESFIKYNSKIYLYGAGCTGARFLPILKKYDCFGGFIDSQEEKQHNGYLEEKVFSLKEFLQYERKGLIVVSTTKKYWDEIEKEFKQNGLIYRENYFFWDEMFDFYFPILASYYYDSCYMRVCQICLTERCTLKCEKCAHGCYNVPSDAQDFTWEDFCITVESFFGKIDYCNEFVLIGGEPLLYGQLAEAIRYIGERYREHIGTFSITTNGTIIPSESVLAESKKYDVLYNISNYSKEIARLEMTHKLLLSVLEDNHIRWHLAKPDSYWLDYGFETVNHNWNEDEMSIFFDKCATACREIRKTRLYYCVMARSVSENLGFNIGKDDYLEMNNLDDNYKKIILEYNLGYNNKGYLDMCRHCNGGENVNTFKIPVARQRSRSGICKMPNTDLEK